MSAPSKPWIDMDSRERRDAIIGMLDEGKSLAQIAATLGAPSRSAVAGIKNHMRAAGELPAPALLSVKDSRSNKKVRGGRPNSNRIAAVRTKHEAARAGSSSQHIHPGNIRGKAEGRKEDPGLPATISTAAAWDPLEGLEPVALIDIPAFGRCRWPVEVDAPGHFMCGAPCDVSAKYCCAHKQLSISPYQPRDRKAA